MLMFRSGFKVVFVTLLILSTTIGAAAQTGIVTLKKQAASGNAKAQFDLGLDYSLGHDVTQDYSQAVTWWRKAAEQGLALVYCHRNDYTGKA